MRVSQETVGQVAPSGTGSPVDVHAFRVTGASIGAELLTYGATLTELRLQDADGTMVNTVLRYRTLDEYIDPDPIAYLGATTGRFSRCIAGAVLRIDDDQYELDANESGHHFHGGSGGFHSRVWTADAEAHADTATVLMTLQSPDGDQGYPGTLDVELAVTVGNDLTLRFDYTATTDTPTIVDLTNHAFWNLDGGRAIDRHHLAINAATRLPVDPTLLPSGPPVPVEGDLDYRTAAAIGTSRLDHCFALDDPSWAAVLTAPRTGQWMRVETDQPGLQVYSGDHLSPSRSGLALQCGAWPDAPNQPSCPPARLDPGQVYRHTTVHQFDATGMPDNLHP